MGWRTRSCKVVKLTNKLALEFSELDSVRDRPLSERRLAVYERMVSQKLFRPCSWAKAFSAESNQWYRVNGQHTSTLFSRLNPLPDLLISVEEYECDTDEDVSRLWATFDSQKGSRTASEINHAFAATIEELREISRRIIDACVTGIAYSSSRGQHGSMYSQVSPAERAEVLFDNSDFVLWVNALGLAENKNRHLLRGGIIAAMYTTYRKAKAKSDEFWRLVISEESPLRTCPTRQLARWTLSTNCQTGYGSASKARKKIADPREFMVRSIHAWNAWRKDEEMSFSRYSNLAPVPNVL